MLGHRPRILVTVYSANPMAQSVPLNGYKFALEIHRVAETRVIAHIRDHRKMRQAPFARDIIFAGSPRWASGLRHLGRQLFGRRLRRIYDEMLDGRQPVAAPAGR